MIDILETNKAEGLAQHTVENLDDFLTCKGDKELMREVINNLKKPFK